MLRIKLVDGTLLTFEEADKFYKSSGPSVDYVVADKAGEQLGRVPFESVLWADNGSAAVKKSEKF